MGKGFSLAIYPWVYTAKKMEDDNWEEKYTLKPHKTPEEEASMTEEEREKLLASRNSFPELPLVNYTTQYGMGCFEGMKAYPQADGSLKIFRPDENAARFARSMAGLGMPPFPEDIFVKASLELVKKNADIGFRPVYNPKWEKDNFLFGESVYLRPFSYAEPGIGLGISHEPWVVFVGTPVGAYFRPGNTKARVSNCIRAFKGGTGWIKSDSNYVVPILEKKRAEAEGYMETIFLDAEKHKYVEEGSSCNIFFLLKNGTLVTPALEDTILPGITRKSLLTLAQNLGVKTEERKITIDEAMSDSAECFVTGTAAGLGYLESITKDDKTAVFNSGKMGELSETLLKTLKGIQYGKVEDKYGWMQSV
ncbi:MAG: aminotransferase class IV [Spirochaetales bacterium]|nr:aminotransferase class IV [Spirochaetales bacterium]